MSLALNPGRVIALAQMTQSAQFGAAMTSDYPDLVSSLLSLLRLRNIPFVVVGGIALLQHVKGRNTEDIDLILSSEDLALVPELLIRERDEMFVLSNFAELRVDVLLAEHPLFRRVAREMSQPMSYGAGRLPTASIDGLIVLKLFALPSLYRQFDFDRVAIYEADITQLLSRTAKPDGFFLEIVGEHLSKSDHTELAEILLDIRKRLSRMRREG